MTSGCHEVSVPLACEPCPLRTSRPSPHQTSRTPPSPIHPAGTPHRPSTTSPARPRVAPSTVSRTFARPGRVNAETAARIRAVADELGTGRTRSPGPCRRRRRTWSALMVSDVANPFYSELIRGAQIAASRRGTRSCWPTAQESATREREALERLMPVGRRHRDRQLADVGLGAADDRQADPADRAEPGAQRRAQRGHRQLRGIHAAVEHLRDLGHDVDHLRRRP